MCCTRVVNHIWGFRREEQTLEQLDYTHRQRQTVMYDRNEVGKYRDYDGSSRIECLPLS